MATSERSDFHVNDKDAIADVLRSLCDKVAESRDHILSELSDLRKEIAHINEKALHGSSMSAVPTSPRRHQKRLRSSPRESLSPQKHILWEPDGTGRQESAENDSDVLHQGHALERTDTCSSLKSPSSSFRHHNTIFSNTSCASFMIAGGIPVHDGYLELCEPFLDAAVDKVRRRTSLVGCDTSELFFSEFRDQHASYMLSPTSRIRIAFDCLSVSFLLYELAVTPYILAWDPPFDQVKTGTYAVTAFWSLDMFMSFRTGYFHHGALTMEPRLVRRRYLRTYFFPDLLLVLLDVVNVLVHMLQDGLAGSTAIRLARLAKATRALRLLKIIRISHMGERLAQLKNAATMFRASKIVVDMVELFFLVFMINHIIACLWYGLTGYVQSDTGYSWLQDPIAPGSKTSYMDSGFGYQYTTSLHWALSQMTPGSMQVAAHNTAERSFNITVLLFGMFAFSTIVSAVSSKMAQHRLRMQDQIATMSTFDRFVRQERVSSELAISMRKQIQERLNESKSLVFGDVQAFHLLSKSLRTQLHVELFDPQIMSLPTFFMCSKLEATFTSKLFSDDVVEVRLLSHAQPLFAVRETAVAAYHIIRGGIKYAHTNQSADTWTDVSAGEWLSEVALWCKWRHKGVAEAAKISEICAVKASELLESLRESPMLFDLVSSYAFAYSRVLNQTELDPTESHDILMPSMAIEHVLVEMPATHQTFIGMTALKCLRPKMWKDAILGDSAIHLLREDLFGGRCTLVAHADVDVWRVVVDVEIELVDNDGSIFVLVAKAVAGTVSASCKLPGRRKQASESFEDTIQMILCTHFGPIAKCVEIGAFKQSVSHRHSRSRGLGTKHIKRVYSAKLSSQLPDIPTMKSRKHTVAIIGDDAEAVQDVVFQVWLKRSEYDYLASPDGEVELNDIVSEICGVCNTQQRSSLVNVMPSESSTLS
eukprot:TRINITY_DN26606_c0_g1_i1.p1 TRINITY_DN26606_c0_g1~~TRINITY_DN26606_c0_g1_i1.p1  ORF type:complete len:951 (-),score=96.39 TRINITY_DN26606_c0_g1_i1:283-3084(-)